jgi:biotin carboxyl carrier protein
MTFEVEAGGRKRIVEVSGSNGMYNAVLDGQVLAVDAAQINGLWSLLVNAAQSGSPDARSTRSGRSYEVAFGEQNGDELVVYVNRRAVPVRLKTPSSDVAGRRIPRRALDSGVPGTEARSGALNITAPMPGRIVKLLVNVGDRVAVRQGVAVVEAMKMENEVRSPRSGTVKEIRVTQGALVEARAVLMVVE